MSHRPRPASALLALLVLTACGSPVATEPGTLAIAGEVRPPAGCRPLAAGSLALLADLAGEPIVGAAPVLLDTAGRFRLAAPAPGLYKVLAGAETQDGRPVKLVAVARAGGVAAVTGASTLVAAGIEPGDGVASAALDAALRATGKALRRDDPPDWSDQRSVRHRLEALITEVAEVRESVAALGPEIGGLRAELGALRDETRSRFEAYQAETAAMIAGLRAETTASIEALRTETRAGIDALAAEVTSLRLGLPVPSVPPAPAGSGPAPLTGDTVTTVAGSVMGFVDAGGRAARFATPRGVAVDAAGNIYVADFDNHRIRRIAPSGMTSTFAGDGYPGATDGVGVAARFDRPIDVAIDAHGFVLVADWGNHRIRRIAPNGTVSTIAGSGPGFADGLGSQARFRGPTGLGLDAEGHIFVADGENHRVRRIAPDGLVTTWAGSASGVPGWLDGPPERNQLYYPADVAPAADGSVYVADGWNHAIRRISPTRELVTIAGAGPGFPGFADGIGREARFNRPSSLVVDAAGDLYVADRLSHALRKLSPAGAVTTVAGAGLPGSRDGTGRLAELNAPTGLALDGAGGLVVADSANHRVRRVGS